MYYLVLSEYTHFILIAITFKVCYIKNKVFSSKIQMKE